MGAATVCTGLTEPFLAARCSRAVARIAAPLNPDLALRTCVGIGGEIERGLCLDAAAKAATSLDGVTLLCDEIQELLWVEVRRQSCADLIRRLQLAQAAPELMRLMA